MTDSKKEFLERKERVMNALSKAVEFSKSNGFEKEAESLAAQYNNVKNEEFVITVIGEFSNGKSYLLNALMGEKLLPSYSGEATAAINFLRKRKWSLILWIVNCRKSALSCSLVLAKRVGTAVALLVSFCQ